MMSKKGSMELGINAIVVLIIALALLGLGIAFVTKLFSSSQSKMVRIIDRTELPIHADATNKMVFDTSNLRVKLGQGEFLIASVYNDGTTVTDSPIQIVGAYNGCVETWVDASGFTQTAKWTPGDASSSISILSPEQTIEARSDAGFAVLVRSTGTQPSTIVCTLEADWTTGGGYTSQHASKQLFIDITS